MRVAVGSDERTSLTDHVLAYLEARGREVVRVGALESGQERAWPHVGYAVARKVASGACEAGVVLCWTGTGVSIAANKVPGARAALCLDAETARGTRLWDDANVLALSLRATSLPVATEILDAWFAPLAGQRDAEDLRCLALMEEIDRATRRGEA